jgi:hypothetical protein
MMMDYYISMFIDNELGLDEKIEFLKNIYEDKGAYKEAVELLEQEKLLRSDMLVCTPVMEYKEKRNWFAFLNFKPVIGLATAVATIAIFILLFSSPFQKNTVPYMPHRFVIYSPGVSKVEISGSFIDWKVLPLSQIGSSGYWQIELNIPKGEHRYTYIVGGERVADPTILAREQDDFGGENSILFVGA